VANIRSVAKLRPLGHLCQTGGGGSRPRAIHACAMREVPTGWPLAPKRRTVCAIHAWSSDLPDALAQLNAALAGRYDVEREIGAGGMATVFLARDLRHERHVALKVLKPELGAVLGVERFFAEIKVTANLQHPNLLPLFDSGEAEGLLFYVMPYVEGESLRARLDREKQLPVDESIRIATAIASALEYAHAHGVIHRDLKPENILFQAGEPVLADFGIALAVAVAGGNRITQTGLSLGTPQYMSPEQATGDRAIDGRTDLYSLAAVLYEMLTGEAPHTGTTAQAIIARVLTDKPRSVRATREMVPLHVEAAIERALAKLPADRFATAKEFAQALGGGYATAPVAGAVGAGKAGQEIRFTISFPKAKLLAVAKWGVVAAAIALGAWGWLRRVEAPPAPRARFALALADASQPREDVGGQNIVISPDGTEIVYVGGTGSAQLFRRRLNELDARPIPGTERAVQPRFSPEGRWLAFVVQNQLKKIPLSGGPAVNIADSVTRYSWGERDIIVLEKIGGRRSAGLWTVSAAGGSPARLTSLDSAAGETAHTWPEVLTGGRAVLFEVQKGSVQSATLAAARLDDGRVVHFGLQGSNARHVASGHLVFGHLEGSVAAAPFDASALRVTGPAVTILEDVVVKSGGATELSVARTGVLAYVEGQAKQQLVLVDRTGLVRPLLPATGRFSDPRFSPTGDRLAFTIGEEGSAAKTDVWILTIASGTLFRLTRDGSSRRPEWSHDGRRVAWTHQDSAGVSIRWQASDGSGAPDTVRTRDKAVLSFAMSPRGVALAVASGPSGRRDIFLEPLDSGSKARPLVNGEASEYSPTFSRDARWLAYVSDESGQSEVYVSPIEGTSGRHQVSTEGGLQPVWAPDGRTLFYRSGGRMMAAALTFAPRFDVARRDTLFTDTFTGLGSIRQFDVTPDGRQFLMLRRGDQQQRLVVVFGWLDELKERMALATKK